MNKKRLIITSVFSITLVAILLIGSTYSVFTTTEIDEDANVYKTGNLDISYTLSEENIKLVSNHPTSIENSILIDPYRVTITNNGNVPYIFDLILTDTTTTDVINYEYIMVQVGKLEPKALSDCSNNIIKEDITVPAGSSVAVDVRVWISDTIQNTEINKSFHAKLSIDGLATPTGNTEVDNSTYIAETILLLSDAKIGSYVAYTGNNGCKDESCNGINANSSDTSNGYCTNLESEFNSSGWRIAYIEEGSTYLISAGSTECMCTNVDGTSSTTCTTSISDTALANKHIDALNAKAITYCNKDYAKDGICDNKTAWNIKNDDFIKITSSALESCYNISDDKCGLKNDLLNIGDSYWYANSYNQEGPISYFSWKSQTNLITNNSSNYSLGIRPILRLDENIIITNGVGTKTNPYIISNTNNE
ncbi:MAG: hypothetical protein IJ509_02620 [Bacilli bacterium]|nr:hypothetical protein [Bacilli bacterium]